MHKRYKVIMIMIIIINNNDDINNKREKKLIYEKEFFLLNTAFITITASCVLIKCLISDYNDAHYQNHVVQWRYMKHNFLFSLM